MNNIIEKMNEVAAALPGVDDAKALRELRNATKLRLAEIKAEKAAAKLARMKERAGK